MSVARVDQAVRQIEAEIQRLDPGQQQGLTEIGQREKVAQVTTRTAQILDSLDLTPAERRQAITQAKQRVAQLYKVSYQGEAHFDSWLRGQESIRNLGAAFESGYQGSLRSSLSQRLLGAGAYDVQVSDRGQAVALFEDVLRSQVNDNEYHEIRSEEGSRKGLISGGVLTEAERKELSALAHQLDAAVVPRSFRERLIKSIAEAGAGSAWGGRAFADPQFIGELQEVVSRVRSEYDARRGTLDQRALETLDALQASLERLKAR